MITIKEKTSEEQEAKMSHYLKQDKVLKNSFGTELRKIGVNCYETMTRKHKFNQFYGLTKVALRQDGKIQTWHV